MRHEVALSSLSEELQSRYWGDASDDLQLPAIYNPAPRPASNQSAKIEARWRVIQEAVDQPKGSPERKAEVLRAAKKWNTPVRTIYRWIDTFETHGTDMNALAHKRPADAGERRVYVSRAFDEDWIAAGHEPSMLPHLADRVDQFLRAAWAGKGQRAGQWQVARYAAKELELELQGQGIAFPVRVDRQRGHIPENRIKQFAEFRIVDIRANDRKRYDDMKPRIRRDNSLFAPMQQVVMDVKPLDVVMRRPDGSEVWPKMIGFMDVGTHRLFRRFVMLPRGEGVRQEHVIDAFKAMVTDPEWGLPQQLYRDNGSEFAMFDKIRAALELINVPGARTIINAKPYSGASKPIESKFATLDRFVFSQIDGWAGGNRMNKKTQTVGKPPKPYPGSFDQFVAEANARIDVFEHEKINSGPFKGKTPAGCFAEHVAAGWRSVRVDPYALEAAFARREKRLVRQSAVSIGGELFRHPELPNGVEVEIALPYQRGAFPLVDLPGLGWAMLQADMPYLPGEIAGAIDSGRMQQRNDRRTGELRKRGGRLDLDRQLTANVVALPTRAAPAPLIDLDMSDQAKSFAGARIAAAEHQAEQLTERERKKRARDLMTEILWRQHEERR